MAWNSLESPSVADDVFSGAGAGDIGEFALEAAAADRPLIHFMTSTDAVVRAAWLACFAPFTPSDARQRLECRADRATRIEVARSGGAAARRQDRAWYGKGFARAQAIDAGDGYGPIRRDVLPAIDERARDMGLADAGPPTGSMALD